MRRRSFLKSAAAFFPAAGLEAFANGQAPGAPSSDQLHVVLSGEDRLGESHSRGYSSILFKVLPRETGNGMFVIEHLNLIEGGPPLHLHLLQEEYFYVVEGEVLFQVGNARKHLKAGDSILGPRGIPHAFACVSKKPGRMLIAFTPAGKMEQFFRDTAIPNAPRMAAEDWSRYDIKYVGPSPFAT
jgi:quercetin dioxygenase-like cupin family protein